MKHILLIEDDEAMRKVIRCGLERAGYAVTEAENGAVGRKMFSQAPVDLVVTDIVMPEVEGIELIQGFRRNSPRLPVIAISGGGRVSPENYLALAQLIGASATFAKPFAMEELIAKADRLLEDAGAV